MYEENFIPSVNFHLWEPCNMKCKFCFATFQDVKNSILPNGHLSRSKGVEVVKQLAEVGFSKITFAGGEPTLCPWLPELIAVAKRAGMSTMLVTNGSRLNSEFLHCQKEFLDWIAISIDSLNAKTNVSIGRALHGKKPLSEEYYNNLIEQVKKFGYGLKINTVVNSKNYRENIAEFIQKSNPKRWKVFQALPIIGQNDAFINEMLISQSEFDFFIQNHNQINCMIAENNQAMTGSYVMVDPAGRFFENTNGTHQYSKPILEVGVQYALNKMSYNFSEYLKRGGIYNW